MIRETLEQLFLQGRFRQEAVVKIRARHRFATGNLHFGETKLKVRKTIKAREGRFIELGQ